MKIFFISIIFFSILNSTALNLAQKAFDNGKYKKAYKYYKRAYINDNKKSLYHLGVFYSSKKTPFHSYPKAYNIFKKLSHEGYAPAQNRIAMFFTFGISGIKKDYKKAVELYELSSKQNFISAQCNLAFMYASGKGVWTNFGRAHAFAKNGKEQGNKICQKVWKDFNLSKYKEDKGWKFQFYTKP